MEPEEKDLKKAKQIHDDDEAEFPEDDLDDDFLDKKTKKPLVEEDDDDSLDKLAEDELEEVDEYNDKDYW